MTENTSVAETPSAAPAPVRSDATQTSVNRKWTLKMLLIVVVLFGFGAWALYDAKVAYPARGINAAEYFEYQYLDLIATNPVRSSEAGIADPVERLDKLREQQKKAGALDEVDRARLHWLESLSLIGRLSPDATAIPRKDIKGVQVDSAAGRLEALTKRWTTAQGGKLQPPKPLSPFDIPSQWVILGVCWAVGVWMAFTLLAAKSKVYRFDPATHTLTLPGGASVSPSDLEEIDKRKWHKFFVSLRVKASHAQLGGKGVELDLLRYEPLEQWVLDMEKAAFPEQAAAS